MPPPSINMDALEGSISKEMREQIQAALDKDTRVQAHVEQLPPYEAAMYIIGNGSISQKVSMLQRLHITLRDCDERKTSDLLGELTQAMWTQELELQVAAPEAIVTVLPRLSEGQLESVLGGTKNMLNVKNEDARMAWSKLALEMVAHLSQKTIVGEFVPLILKKVAHSEPADQRKLGCKLVGRVCRKLAQIGHTEVILSSGLLQRALQLCQDTERYMRAEMCGQLIDIARAVGPAAAKEKITGELFQLVADEEPTVARAALSAVVLDFVDFYDPAYRKEHVWPVLRSYLQSPQEEFVSLLAEVFGRFLCKVKGDLATSPEDVALLAAFFRMCSQKPDAELRRWCAFNFPAVVTVFPYSVFAATLAPVLKALASDAQVPVRRCVAAGLHELIPLLGDRAAAPLKEPVLLLLQDASLDVRHIIFRRLGGLLDLFAHQLRHDERDAFFSAVMPHIVSYEAAVHRDWRLSATLLESFNHFTRFFPGAVLSARLVPPLMHHLLYGAAAVKDLCAPLLIHFTRALAPNNAAIAERFGRIVHDFGRSGNCHHRRMFVHLFCASVGVFSRKFLRVRMMETVLELANDRIPNVRLQLARAMPVVRRVLKSCAEAEVLSAFHAAWDKLLRDADADVRDAAVHVRNALEDMERDFSRQIAMRVQSSEDAADRKREEAEGDLSDLAREMEKNERRQRLRDMLLKDPADIALGGGDILVGDGGIDGALPIGGGGSFGVGGRGNGGGGGFSAFGANGGGGNGFGVGGAAGDIDHHHHHAPAGSGGVRPLGASKISAGLPQGQQTSGSAPAVGGIAAASTSKHVVGVGAGGGANSYTSSSHHHYGASSVGVPPSSVSAVGGRTATVVGVVPVATTNSSNGVQSSGYGRSSVPSKIGGAAGIATGGVGSSGPSSPLGGGLARPPPRQVGGAGAVVPSSSVAGNSIIAGAGAASASGAPGATRTGSTTRNNIGAAANSANSAVGGASTYLPPIAGKYAPPPKRPIGKR